MKKIIFLIIFIVFSFIDAKSLKINNNEKFITIRSKDTTKIIDVNKGILLRTIIEKDIHSKEKCSLPQPDGSGATAVLLIFAGFFGGLFKPVDLTTISPNNEFIVIVSQNEARVHILSIGKLKYKINHDNKITNVLISQDSKVIITLDESNLSKITNLNDGKLLYKINERVKSLTSDSKLLISSKDNFFNTRNILNGKLIYALDNDNSFSEPIVSSDSKFIITTSKFNDAQNTINVHNLLNGKLVYKINKVNEYKPVQISKNNEFMITCEDDNLIRISDLNTRKILYTIASNSSQFLISGNSKCLIIRESDELKIIDLNTGLLLYTIAFNKNNYELPVISSDSKFIVLYQNENIGIYDLMSGKLLHNLEHKMQNSECIPKISISRDDKSLIILGNYNDVKVIDLNSGILLHHLELNGTDVSRDKALYPNDKFVITIGQDDTARIENLKTGKYQII